MPTYLNEDQTKDFHDKGYVVVKNFFNKDETYLLQNASKKDPAIRDHLYEIRKSLDKPIEFKILKYLNNETLPKLDDKSLSLFLQSKVKASH